MSQHFTYPGDGAEASLNILNDAVVRASGDSGEITGTDALQEITARAAVRRLKAGQTITVAIEHSDDGESWDEGDSHEFDGDGDATLTLDTPKTSTRVTWTLTGTNPQPYLTVDLTGSAPTAGQVNQTVKNATPDGGSQPVTGTGDPVSPVNGYFSIAGADNTSGDFKLTFRGQTTAALPYSATGGDVAAALEALSTIGNGNATPYPEYENVVINDTTYVVWTGALGGSIVETPTVTDDTTDNGVTTTLSQDGVASVPADPTVGVFYIDTETGNIWLFDSVNGVTQWVQVAAFINGNLLTAGGVFQAGLNSGTSAAMSSFQGFTLNTQTAEAYSISPGIGFYSTAPATNACYNARGGAGATVALDCGSLAITNLPTVDPGVAGALWNDSGTPAISAG